jgi:regulator of replication initiation timing
VSTTEELQFIRLQLQAIAANITEIKVDVATLAEGNVHLKAQDEDLKKRVSRLENRDWVTSGLAAIIGGTAGTLYQIWNGGGHA